MSNEHAKHANKDQTKRKRRSDAPSRTRASEPTLKDKCICQTNNVPRKHDMSQHTHVPWTSILKQNYVLKYSNICCAAPK